MAYYPKSQVTTNLFTSGGEFFKNTSPKEEYIGYYWTNSSGQFFSGKNPDVSPSFELTKIKNSSTITPTNVTFGEGPLPTNPSTSWVTRYSDITSKPPGKLPQKHQNIPTEKDYELGEYQRYYTKKRNQNSYFEISKEDYTLLQTKNNKIQYQLYLPIILSWVISGDKNEVYNTNKNIVKLTEKRLKLPGFTQYFKDNFTQYCQEDLDYTN